MDDFILPQISANIPCLKISTAPGHSERESRGASLESDSFENDAGDEVFRRSRHILFGFTRHDINGAL
jgi:hypothetical protein